MDNIKIIKLPVGRWEEYKKIRLEALKNEPTAFAASYDEKSKKEDEYWQNQLKKFQVAEEDSMWFAEVSNELIGLSGWYRSNTEKLRHAASIYAVYIKPAFRGKGIAKKLIKKVMEELQTKPEIIRFDLNVNTKNANAVELYKKLGFEIVGTLHKEMYIDGEYYDEYEMEKMIR